MNKILIVTILVLLCADLASGQFIWTQKKTFPGEYSWQSVGFSIGGRGYIGTGASNPANLSGDLYHYDTLNNIWIKRASLPISVDEAVGFSIGDKGYIGTGATGSSGNLTNQFFEYDPVHNTWTAKANFGGTPRDHAFAFSLNGKGYIGGGDDENSNRNDLWEYNPQSDTWTEKTSMPISWIKGAIAFSINNKAYVGVGLDSSGYSKIFFEYDPTLDTWTRKANFSGNGRWEAVGFAIGNYGYVGTGLNPTDLNDFWQYDPTQDSWKRLSNFPGSPRYDAIGFVIGNSGYLGIGSEHDNEFYKFTPDISMAIHDEVPYSNQINIFPNPFSFETSLQAENPLKDAMLVIYNAYGQEVKQIKNIFGRKIKIKRDNLETGFYFILVTQNNSIVLTEKIEIID